jgi:competence protein ComEC
LWGSGIAVRLSWSDKLTVTALDVGQGESVVLTCGPRTVMVDCGGSFMTKDAGESAVSFLRGRQRRHVDALILSHLHSDHVNGAARVISQLDVDTLYLPAQDDEDGYLAEILLAAADAGTAVEYVTENMILSAGDMEITVWSPLLPGDENENCLIVMARQDDFEVFITGDSPSAAELLLTARYELPDAEVLVAGHHGSDTSTCREFLEEIRPDLALISVGYNNYGHPSSRVLSRLKEYDIEVLRTDQMGDISVRSGGKNGKKLYEKPA